mmetsp:Transcript_19205/g.43457  ORF Transcript_19205/g.43457 Transcript_19205/m.43457 type:complete len:228 (-) Transcript_19205:169-852(-)
MGLRLPVAQAPGGVDARSGGPLRATRRLVAERRPHRLLAPGAHLPYRLPYRHPSDYGPQERLGDRLAPVGLSHHAGLRPGRQEAAAAAPAAAQGRGLLPRHVPRGRAVALRGGGLPHRAAPHGALLPDARHPLQARRGLGQEKSRQGHLHVPALHVPRPHRVPRAPKLRGDHRAPVGRLHPRVLVQARHRHPPLPGLLSSEPSRELKSGCGRRFSRKAGRRRPAHPP